MAVSDAICNNTWRWPAEWLEKYHILKEIEVPNLTMQKEDQTVWKSANGKLVESLLKLFGKFSISRGTMVRWHKVVWFTQCNPRMAFILWMAEGQAANSGQNYGVE